jgi:Acetyltransferase (GNAT) domain
MTSTTEPALEVRVLRTIQDVELARETWSTWKTHRDSDIDYCLQTVWPKKEFIRPHVIAIYRRGKLDALLVGRLEHNKVPLRLGYINLLNIPAKTLSFAYRGLLGNDSPENSAEFVRSIEQTLERGEADLANFQQLIPGSSLHDATARSKRFGTRDRAGSPLLHHVIALSGNIEEDLKGLLSSGHRRELRQKKRKILAAFEDQMSSRCYRDPSEVQAIIPQIEEIAHKTYQRGLEVGFQDNEDIRNRMLFCATKGWLRVYLVTVQNQPAAYISGTVYERCFCIDFMGYDPALREYSIGKILTIEMIEDCCREGVETVDFGFGSGLYKERFGNRSWPETSMNLYAPNVKGLVIHGLQTSLAVSDRMIKNFLERTNLLPRIKTAWRARASKAK